MKKNRKRRLRIGRNQFRFQNKFKTLAALNVARVYFVYPNRLLLETQYFGCRTNKKRSQSCGLARLFLQYGAKIQSFKLVYPYVKRPKVRFFVLIDFLLHANLASRCTQKYTVGCPKAKALARFVCSASILSIPWEKGCL